MADAGTEAVHSLDLCQDGCGNMLPLALGAQAIPLGQIPITLFVEALVGHSFYGPGGLLSGGIDSVVGP